MPREYLKQATLTSTSHAADVTRMVQGILDEIEAGGDAAVFDNLDEFRAENANARQIDPAKSLNLAIPLHEGARRYFEK